MTNKNLFFTFDTKSDEVIDQLKEYDRQYYNDGKSEVSDDEYDTLKTAAKQMDPENPYFQKVGAKVESKKVKLQYVLGSLNKVRPDTVEAWMNKMGETDFLVMEKLDGASIEVDYLDGKVQRAMTRGDGFTGQDITEKAKIFCPKISHPGELHLRAEAMLIGDKHKKLGFKTRRNGVVGILNRDDLKNAEMITPIFYEILNVEYPTQTNMIKLIEYLFGIENTVDWALLEKNDALSLIDFLGMLKEKNDYDIDGLVICPVNYKRENVEYPENKVAFKVNEKPVKVKVQKVEWNVGRTGRVIPLVWVEPTEIQGVTVSKATGFNYKYIVDNKIGKDSYVWIVRSGDVIPYIVKSEGEGFGPRFPHNCPTCEKGLSPVGVDLICKNPDCPAKSLKRIEHFLIRMGAENITKKTIEKLDVSSIEDLYILDEFEIAEIPGLGIKRAEQILNEIEKTLKTTPEKFISSLSIPMVGRTVSRLVVEWLKPQCENEDHLMQVAFNLTPAQLTQIDGVGDAIANSWFKNIRMYGESLLSFLQNQGMKWDSGSDELPYTFTLTGKGPMSRSAIETLIKSKGGVSKGIGKNTDYLVAANPDSQSGKAKKARQYGTKIISYEQLMEMLGE